jgi:hypothetical protein
MMQEFLLRVNALREGAGIGFAPGQRDHWHARGVITIVAGISWPPEMLS